MERARAVELEALRFARSGDFDRAANLADGEVQRLTAMGDGRVSAPDRFADGVVELQARLDAEGRLVDATRDGLGLGAAPALRQALEKRMEAVDAFQSGCAREGLRGARAVRLAPRRRRGQPGLGRWRGCGRCRRRSPPVSARWQRRPGPGRCSR